MAKDEGSLLGNRMELPRREAILHNHGSEGSKPVVVKDAKHRLGWRARQPPHQESAGWSAASLLPSFAMVFQRRSNSMPPPVLCLQLQNPAGFDMALLAGRPPVRVSLPRVSCGSPRRLDWGPRLPRVRASGLANGAKAVRSGSPSVVSPLTFRERGAGAPHPGGICYVSGCLTFRFPCVRPVIEDVATLETGRQRDWEAGVASPLLWWRWAHAGLRGVRPCGSLPPSVESAPHPPAVFT